MVSGLYPMPHDSSHTLTASFFTLNFNTILRVPVPHILRLTFCMKSSLLRVCDSVNVSVPCRLWQQQQIALVLLPVGYRGMLNVAPTASTEQLNPDPGKWMLTFFSHLYCASCYYQRFVLPTDAQDNCFQRSIKIYMTPLNTELNPIYHLLTLLEPHYILHVSRIRVTIKIASACFGVITIIRERTAGAC